MTQQRIDDSFIEHFDALVTARGFFAWGAADAGPVREMHRYREALARRRHASMSYLERHESLREDPRLLVPGARTVLVFLRSYAWPCPPRPDGHGLVAAYARGLDYHESMKRDLRAVTAALAGYRTRFFVDTGPVLERYWARAAGLASLGKNTMCLNRAAGSSFFIAVALTTAPFPPTGGPHELDLCGSCDRCVRACPTGALSAPYELDATRCLSYLTVEYRGAVPPPYRSAVGAVVFGCDRCQDACPYNRDASVAGHPDFRPRPPLAAPDLRDVVAWGPEAFRTLTRHSAVARATREGLQRTCLLAAANLGQRSLLEIVARDSRLRPLDVLAAELLGARFK